MTDPPRRSPVIAPTIETARLTLRPPVEADLEGWAAFMADTRPCPVAWRGMAATAGSWVLRGFGRFSVVERASGRRIGRAGPLRPEG